MAYPQYNAPYPSQPGYPSQVPPAAGNPSGIGFENLQGPPGLVHQPGVSVGSMYPQSNSPYPSSGGGYPNQNTYTQAGYPPPPGAGSYPQQAQGYPSGGAYPQAVQPGYGTGAPGPYPASGSFPQPVGGGYPQSGYPQQGHGYPGQQNVHGGGYPPQPQQHYPPAQSGYPGAGQPGYGPAPTQPGYGNYPNPAMSQPQNFPSGMQHGYPQQQQMSVTPMHSYQTPNQGTVRPAPSCNPNQDAEALKKAMKGFGCDDKSVINILCHRTNAQRQQIKLAFKTMYGKDMVKELISELRGNLEDVLVALMYTPAEFDATSLRRAMEGAGTKESVLIEIMCSRTNAEIHAIKDTYHRLFRRNLENDLASETSGYFKRLLVSMSVGGRDESGQVDPARAKQDADKLFRAGVKQWGTDEATFNAVLAANSFPHLQVVFNQYQHLAHHDIEKAIMSEFSGDICDGLLAVVKCAKNRPAYFAERLYLSMKGMGTQDDQLIRVVVSRCEVDMVQIKHEFKRLYSKTLESFITGDASGKYKEALVTLVQG